MSAGVTIQAEALRRFVAAVVAAGGSSEREATLVAHNLVEGEQRPGIYLEDAARDLFNAPCDPEAVHRLQAERLQDQHVECALDYVSAVFVHHADSSTIT